MIQQVATETSVVSHLSAWFGGTFGYLARLVSYVVCHVPLAGPVMYHHIYALNMYARPFPARTLSCIILYWDFAPFLMRLNISAGRLDGPG